MRRILTVLFVVLAFGNLQAQNVRRLTLTSTTVNGSTKTGSAPAFTVNTGESISGSFTVNFTHNLPEEHEIPLVATPNWGNKQSDFWEVKHDVTNGSYTTGSISLTAPSTAGTYYLILAAYSETSAACVISGTAWTNSSGVVWNDGNDFFDLTQTQLNTARTNGTLNWRRLKNGIYYDDVYGVTAIQLTVESNTAAMRKLTLTSTTVNGSTKTGSAPVFTVNAGESLNGSFTVNFIHNLPEYQEIPLVATPNWGNKQSDFWEVQHDITNGSSTTGNFSLTTPSTPGTYYLILVSYSETDAASVISGTAWTNSTGVVWNDGNDFFDLTQTQLNTARTSGTLNWPRLRNSIYTSYAYGVTAIQLTVEKADEITVTNPSSGAVWHSGTTREITWNDNISGNVKIEWYADDWTLLDVLSTSTPSDGSFNWSIPSTVPNYGGYKIKVLSEADNEVFGWSPGLFKISNIDVQGTLGLSYPAGSNSVSVTSNVNWSVSDNVSWLTATRDGYSLTVNYDANPNTSSRSAIITLTGGGITKTILVTQAAAPACAISVTPESRSVGSSSGIITFSVTSNVTWSTSDDAAWLTTSKSGNSINVSYEANPTIDARSATITVSGGGCSKTVSVTQAAADCSIIVDPSNRKVGFSSGTTTFTVTSNVNWDVIDDATWLTASKNGNIINVSYHANPDIGSRTAPISVSGGGCSGNVTVIQSGIDCDISAVPVSRIVSFASGSCSFEVTSENDSWSVADDATWLNAGKNGNLIDVSYEANTSTIPRMATITITAGECTSTVTVNQEPDFVIHQLILTSASINGSLQTGSMPEFSLEEDQEISGTFTVRYTHNQPDDQTIPLAATPNWGERENDFWEVKKDITNGSTNTGSIALTAPGSPGSYYIIIAAHNDLSAAQVMSATSWEEKEIVWNDGNDLFDLSEDQLRQARMTGTLVLPKFNLGFHNDVYGVTAIKLNVGTSDIHSYVSPKIEIYPNPTSGLLTISSSHLVSSTIRIYSTLGKQLYVKEAATMEEVIDLGPYSHGIYILVISDSKNKVQLRRKIIKR